MAIAINDKLLRQNSSDRTQQFCQWLNQLAGSKLKLDDFFYQLLLTTANISFSL